jgi:threonine/homoserine/homoserine lactone efflux protein
MTFESWIAFVLAAGIILIIPGPTIFAVISHSLAWGRRAVLPLVAGVALGDLTALVVSLVGLGAVLAASAALFSTLKLFGALYLVYLGIKLIRADADRKDEDSDKETLSRVNLLSRLYVITALNPKSIVFFIAFLPQFVNPALPGLPQFLILGGTFLSLAVANATFYAFFAGQIRERVQSRMARICFNRCGGIVLIGAGFITAALRRT